MQEAPVAYQVAGTVIAAIVGLLVGRDAREQKRTLSESAWWAFGVFMAMILVLPAYLYYRNKIWPLSSSVSPEKKVTGTCRYCGTVTENDPIYCPSCSMQLRGAESVHGKK